ncbi:hypothetical protein NM897_02420 [Planococcus maritimus]|uniref:hypothetical protein n=1 Tax=Planococcus maritimus TaxID=192421 RepID=UPI003138E2EF
MSENRKTAILVFGLGLVATLLALPFLYALGLPSFEVVLMGLFGEGNPWALARFYSSTGSLNFLWPPQMD